MNALRWAYATALGVLIALPILLPMRELIRFDAWTWSAADWARMQHLGQNTITLCGGTLAIALPAGILLASLLFRTSFLSRRFLLSILFLLLFVPLPVIVASWQGMFGSDGWLPWTVWPGDVSGPWARGMNAAIWLHAMAALPWVTFIIGMGLTWVEPELESSAAQSIGPWRVWTMVTLPRARASILAAALFVVLQSAGEISVTDMVLVSTLAEEAHTQFTLPQGDALPRVLVISLPMLLLTWGMVMLVLSRLERGLPPIASPARSGQPLALGPQWTRWLGATAFVLLVVVPLTSLLWKLGRTGHPGHWEAGVAWQFLFAQGKLLGPTLVTSLLTAFVTGVLIASQALVIAWLARDRVWFRWLAFSVLTWAWVLPGPVIGLALHDLIATMVGFDRNSILAVVLYDGPSPIPVMWAQAIRVLPMAVVFLYPVVRMIPREFDEEAKLTEARPLGLLSHVVLPLTWRATGVTALAASALCLSEVGASLRVDTPGWQPFTQVLFNQMHYGADNNMAALCVLLLGCLLLLGLLAGILKRCVRV